MSDFKIQNLFSTPVWSVMVPNAAKLNSELLAAGGDYKPRTNYFNLPSPAVEQLRQIVLDKAHEIAQQYGWRYPISFVKGRQNPIGPQQSDSPHHHGSAKLVGVYYPKADAGQGDILLHDPRAGVDWQDPQARTDAGKTLRTFHRITPVSGLLLLFPGYLVHSVEHNPTKDVRVSIAIEIYTSQPSENDYLS